MKWHSCSQFCTTNAAFFSTYLLDYPVPCCCNLGPKLYLPITINTFFMLWYTKWVFCTLPYFDPKKRCSFLIFFFMLINIFLCECCNVHSLSKCLAWVACLWSKMLMFQREWGRESYSISFSIFASYDMKCLWFKFGYNIFTGFKMARP